MYPCYNIAYLLNELKMKKKSTYRSSMFAHLLLHAFSYEYSCDKAELCPKSARQHYGQILFPSEQSDLESKEERSTIYAIYL